MRLILVMLLFSISAYAGLRQNYIYKNNYSYGLGIVTNSLIGNTSSSEPILRSEDFGFGGSGLNVAQTGLDARFTYYLDEENKWRIPVNFEYIFYRANEAIYSNTLNIYYQNDINLMNFSVGLNYSFYYSYFANAWLYGGVEIVNSYFQMVRSNYREVGNLDETEFVNSTTNFNEGAFRLGPRVRIGAEAELQEKIMINFSFYYHLINLLGRDDEVGNLFPPEIISEDTEVFEHIIGMSIIIQYRL